MPINLDNEPLIIQAAAKGNHELVLHLIRDQGHDVETVASNGATAIAFAAFYGHLEVAKILVQQNCNIEASATFDTISGMTPFLLAAQAGNVQMVKLLLSNGAHYNILAGEDGEYSAETLAKDNPKIVNILENVRELFYLAGFSKVRMDSYRMPTAPRYNGFGLSAPSDSVFFPLLVPSDRIIDKGFIRKFSAERASSTPMLEQDKEQRLFQEMQACIREGASVMQRLAENDTDTEDSLTPLHRAIGTGSLPAVRALIALRSDVKARDSRGNTALLLACETSYSVEIVDFLLSASGGATLDEENTETDTALSLSLHFPAIYQYLIEKKGFPLDQRNKYGETILSVAALHGSWDFLKYLFEKSPVKPEINAVDNLGFNALMNSLQAGLHGFGVSIPIVVKYLISKGINIEAVDNSRERKSALVLAEERLPKLISEGNLIVAEQLKEAIGILKAALELNALARGEIATRTLKVLLEAGASVHQRGKDGKTPLHLVIESEAFNITLLEGLLDKGADIEAQDNSNNNCVQIANKLKNYEMLAICLLYCTKLAKKGEQVDIEAAAEFTDRAFWVADGLEDPAREDLYYKMGMILKEKLHVSDYAYKAFEKVTKISEYYEEARNALAELRFSCTVIEKGNSIVPMSLDDTLDEQDPALIAARKKNLEPALLFSLEASSAHGATKLREGITRVFLGIGLSDAIPFEDPTTPKGAFQLMLQYKKEKGQKEKHKRKYKEIEDALQEERVKNARLEAMLKMNEEINKEMKKDKITPLTEVQSSASASESSKAMELDSPKAPKKADKADKTDKAETAGMPEVADKDGKVIKRVFS